MSLFTQGDPFACEHVYIHLSLFSLSYLALVPAKEAAGGHSGHRWYGEFALVVFIPPCIGMLLRVAEDIQYNFS